MRFPNAWAWRSGRGRRHDVAQHLVVSGLGELEHLGQRPRRRRRAALLDRVRLGGGEQPALDEGATEAGHGLALPRLFERS